MLDLFGVDGAIIEKVIASGGFGLLLSMGGNVTQFRQNKAERRRTDDAIAERKELAKKYQDHLEDYNTRTDGNIAVIIATKTTLDNIQKTMESQKCQYLTK